MGKSVLLNRVALVGGHRISRDANQLAIGTGRSEEAATTLEDSGYNYLLGVHSGDFSFQGYTDDALEARFLTEIAKSTVPSTPVCFFLVAGNGAAGGDIAQMDGCPFTINVTGEHGRIHRFEMAGKPHKRLAIGSILETSVGGAGITGAQDGTAVNLGAITTTQKMVAVFHVLNFPAAEGTSPTLDGKIQSATDEAFTTPVDRITFAQSDGTPAGVVSELAGPVTDTWWRYVVTAVGGTATPKMWVVVSAAIVTV